jgi:hypothetical protein
MTGLERSADLAMLAPAFDVEPILSQNALRVLRLIWSWAAGGPQAGSAS